MLISGNGFYYTSFGLQICLLKHSIANCALLKTLQRLYYSGSLIESSLFLFY